ncbi:MAG: UDP-N-acetylmuramoyl-tripeptide--D-alanyl-D-alanine ligase [Chitinophagaceae bacterium]|nr:UDP-N-acetylmuramoyl-tripeptide--D-alanyl-D-alanine ligase [Chitinophagaceae bacterium]
MQIEELYKLYLRFPSVQTDTRKLKKGDLFFALKGPNFNGNEFAQQALEAGAAYAIVDEQSAVAGDRMILTDDVLTTLQKLAGYHRQQFTIPFIGITGSNGKTTTKELVHAVLSTTFKTYTTQGNLNNHIGIPLTILGIKPDAEVAVIEMGANHPKEIQGYCEYARPTHGIITNCGKAHLEGFGSVEGVRKAKGELFDYLRFHHGTAFIMKDYDYLGAMSRDIPHVYTYGTHDAMTTGIVREAHPFLEVTLTDLSTDDTIRTHLAGAYNLPNILAAVAVGRYFKIEDREIKSAIEAYEPSNIRSQLIKKGANTILLDAYNANPSSMKAAVENFASMSGGNKILILGAMAELGAESIKEHQALIRLLEQYQWREVILVGGDFEKTVHSYQFFGSVGEAEQWLRSHPVRDSLYLIKGSRSMKMEQIMEAL